MWPLAVCGSYNGVHPLEIRLVLLFPCAVHHFCLYRELDFPGIAITTGFHLITVRGVLVVIFSINILFSAPFLIIQNV